MNARLLRRCALLALMLATFIACGRKAAPLIPDSPRPAAVKELRAVCRDSRAYLSWFIPKMNVEGKMMRPSDIQRFVVMRMDLEQSNSRLQPYADIVMTAPGTRTVVRDDVVEWSDGPLEYGHTYAYQVRAVSERGGFSPLSPEVRITPVPGPLPPSNISVRALDGSVLLSWGSVTRRSNNAPVEGAISYSVFRGADSMDQEGRPLNGSPLTATTYKDASVSNGRTYYYTLRSTETITPNVRTSIDSVEVSATPKDQTAPARPNGLTAVPGVDRVFLSWNENTERDLAGYHVYRSTKTRKDYTRLTTAAITRTTYYDDTARGGTAYRYVVTAVDKAGNESPRSEEKNVFVEKLR